MLGITLIWILFTFLGLSQNLKMVAALLLILCSVLGSKFSVFGLTGGIACGKSTVSNELIENGWIVIDADKISREI